MDCSRFIEPVTMLWSELSTFTFEVVLPPTSTLASRTAAGVGSMGRVILALRCLVIEE